MKQTPTFGEILRERRSLLGLTQAELARRAGCAPITVRKMEGDALRPSVQLAELLALALQLPEGEQANFVRLARHEKPITPIPRPTPSVAEIGLEDLTGRAVKGFQLAELIGSGGFGVVYRAVQSSVQRDVAVKIILPRFANHPTFIRRFEAEAHLVARLEHPHIVPLYDYWREPNAAYLIMRLLRAGSLDKLLQQGPLELNLFRQIVFQVGRALAVAHANNVVHRDIKPANILLDDAQNAYLGDFGIAKILDLVGDGAVTEAGALIGSPAYISPEQIQNEPIRPSSDIYCFGLLLFEMLTGRKAFPGPTPLAYLQQHLNEPTPSLLEIMPNLPPAIDTILQRASAKEPAARFPSMEALLDSLDQVLVQSTLDISSQHLVEGTAVPDLSTQEIAALENPYRGLRAFTESDAENFFGRATLVQELLSLMSDGSDLERFLAVVGPSGSGKSSLVKAGLLPALRRGGLPGSENWFIVDLTPGGQPWAELAAALRRVAVNSLNDLEAQLQADHRGLLRAVTFCLPDDGETELLLVIDQFEELFTLVEEEAVREAFLQSLVTAVLDPGSRVRIVMTLRADFTDRPLQYVDFGELVQRRIALVLPLMSEDLIQAITGPIEKLRLIMAPELISTIVQDVRDQPGTLPLLQYALTELFEQRQGRVLTLETYQETGMVAGALARRADELFNSFDSTGQEAVRQLFLRLITLGDGVEDTRCRVLISELKTLAGNREQSVDFTSYINAYGRYRLLTFDHDPMLRGPTVEIAHEALFREWPRLRNWLHESREDIWRQRELAQAANKWHQNNFDESYLLRGSRLSNFEAWALMSSIKLTETENNFLQTSTNAENMRRAAEESQRQISFSRELGYAALINLEQDPERSLLLSRKALSIAHTTLAESALRVALQSSRVRLRVKIHGSGKFPYLVLDPTGKYVASGTQGKLLIWRVDNGEIIADLPLVGWTDYVFTRDGSLLLVATTEGTVNFFDCETGNLTEQLKVSDVSLTTLAIKHDNSLLAVGNKSGHLSVLSLDSRQELYRIPVCEGQDIWWTDFNPDGSRIGTHDQSYVFRLWNSKTGEEMLRLGPVHRFSGFAFSPAGDLLYSGVVTPASNEVYIWNVSDTAVSTDKPESIISDLHNNALLDVKFSPDGRRFVTTGVDSRVKIWNSAAPKNSPHIILAGQVGGISQAMFTIDGQSIISSGRDDICVWSASRSGFGEVLSFPAHEAYINNLALSPDGRHIASVGSDSFACIWNSKTGDLIHALQAHESDVWAVDYNPDGSLLATAGRDNTIKLWDAVSGDLIRTLAGHRNGVIGGLFEGVVAVDFNFDGSLLASAGSDGTARIWAVATGEQLQELRPHPDGSGVTNVQFSPNGHQLAATTDFPPLLALWDVKAKMMTCINDNFSSSRIWGLAYSPDGLQIALGEGGGRLSLYNSVDAELAYEFPSHMSTIFMKGVAFSQDGRLLMSVSGAEGIIKVWDYESKELLNEIKVPYGISEHLFFTSNGNHIVTAGGGLVINVYTLVLDELLTIADARVTRTFTEDECRQYLHLQTCADK